MKDVKEKKCGCIQFEVGPPVLCEKHQHKLEKKEKREAKRAARETAREEKGLRKTVAQQAQDNGHDLSRFKEYGSRPGKWTAHCHSCGAIVIVYDTVPEYGDQIAGAGVFKACEKSALVGTLGAAEREAIAARFKGNEDDEEESSDTADSQAV